MPASTEKPDPTLPNVITSESRAARKRLVVLVIGEVSTWYVDGKVLPWGADNFFADFNDVEEKLLSNFAPDVILSILMSSSFDCLTLAQLLHEIGFSGRYRIILARLPNPEMVLSELRAICPGLDVKFAGIGDSFGLNLH